MPTMSSAPENNFQSRGAYILPFELSTMYSYTFSETLKKTVDKHQDSRLHAYCINVHSALLCLSDILNIVSGAVNPKCH